MFLFCSVKRGMTFTRKRTGAAWKNWGGLEEMSKAWRSAELLPALLVLALITSGAAHSEDTIGKFIAQYRCPVVDRLERLYAKGDPKRYPDEYLIIDVRGVPEHYVQCLFFAHGKLYCEAASGFYTSKIKSERSYLPRSAILALDQLGFSIDDSEGNFKIELDVSDPPDFVGIAELMLRAMHAVRSDCRYKARFSSPIRAS
jgi:hypothetical protein